MVKHSSRKLLMEQSLGTTGNSSHTSDLENFVQLHHLNCDSFISECIKRVSRLQLTQLHQFLHGQEDSSIVQNLMEIRNFIGTQHL